RLPPLSTSLPYTTLFRSHRRYTISRLLYETSTSPYYSASSYCSQYREHWLLLGSKPHYVVVIPYHRHLFPKIDCFVVSLACQMRSEEHTSELQSRFDLVC